MIETVIFDMDGLLIDTEPLWRKAEIKVFGKYGLHITEEDCLRTMGLRIDEAVGFWYDLHPWEGASVAEVSEEIMDEMVILVRAEGKALPGVYAAMELFERKGIPMLLASSTPMRLIEVIIDHLEIRERLVGIFSAENEKHGKPHPAVFLTAADSLGTDPQHCLVFEDSFNGVLAAKAARMRCIAIPETQLAGDPRFVIADFQLESMEEFGEELLQKLAQ